MALGRSSGSLPMCCAFPSFLTKKQWQKYCNHRSRSSQQRVCSGFSPDSLFNSARRHRTKTKTVTFFAAKIGKISDTATKKLWTTAKKTDAFYEFSRIVYFKNFVYLCRRIIMPLPSPEPFREGANNWLSVNYKINSKNNEKYENNFETLNSETFSFFIT